MSTPESQPNQPSGPSRWQKVAWLAVKLLNPHGAAVAEQSMPGADKRSERQAARAAREQLTIPERQSFDLMSSPQFAFEDFEAIVEVRPAPLDIVDKPQA